MASKEKILMISSRPFKDCGYVGAKYSSFAVLEFNKNVLFKKYVSVTKDHWFDAGHECIISRTIKSRYGHPYTLNTFDDKELATELKLKDEIVFRYDLCVPVNGLLNVIGYDCVRFYDSRWTEKI